jgi:hypothetical protein
MTALAVVIPLPVEREDDPQPHEICERAPGDLLHREDVQDAPCGGAQLCSLCLDDHRRACTSCAFEERVTADVDDTDDCWGDD